MTDNEIVKALKECEECHYYNKCKKSIRLALDLVNRYKAEIESLKESIQYGNEICENCQADKDKGLKKAKSESRKEFAEKVDKLLTEHSRGDIDDTELYRLFGSLEKEMESESNAE